MWRTGSAMIVAMPLTRQRFGMNWDGNRPCLLRRACDRQWRTMWRWQGSSKTSQYDGNPQTRRYHRESCVHRTIFTQMTNREEEACHRSEELTGMGMKKKKSHPFFIGLRGSVNWVCSF